MNYCERRRRMKSARPPDPHFSAAVHNSFSCNQSLATFVSFSLPSLLCSNVVANSTTGDRLISGYSTGANVTISATADICCQNITLSQTVSQNGGAYVSDPVVVNSSPFFASVSDHPGTVMPLVDVRFNLVNGNYVSNPINGGNPAAAVSNQDFYTTVSCGGKTIGTWHWSVDIAPGNPPTVNIPTPIWTPAP